MMGRSELNPYLSLSVSVKDGTHYRPTVQESRFSEVLAALEIGDRNHVYVAFDSVAAIDRMIEELRDLRSQAGAFVDANQDQQSLIGLAEARAS